MKTLARERDKAEVLERLKNLRPDSKAQWGAMSAHQMVCHLADGLRMFTGEKPTLARARILERTLLKWVVLYVPLRWPRGVSTSPEIHQEMGGTRPADFAVDVAQVAALVESVAASGPGDDPRVHPLFGGMSHAAWLRWAYLHADHHLRQFGA